MIKSIKLKNFKVWKHTDSIKMAPVTLVLGTNSSGKSSLFQPFLLLKQTVSSADRTIHLNLGGDQVNDFVDVGGFINLLHKRAKEQRIGIRIEFDNQNSDAYTLFDAEYMRDSSFSPVVSSLSLADSQTTFRVIRRDKGAFSIYSPQSKQPVAKSRSFSPERSIAFSAEAVAALGEEGSRVQDISLRIRRYLEQIAYLGPLRTRPSRDYTWNKVRPGVLGDDGQNTAYVLAAAAESKKSQDEEIISEVSKWLNRMNLAEKIEVRHEGRSGRYRIDLVVDGEEINLKDVGIGVSQVLPVLVIAYFAPENSTIILEEPEIHLHPLAQAELAELFVHVAKTRKVQFLVETHSEHIFRRMQTIISRDDLNTDQCALYFIENSGSEAQLKKLEADEYGRVGNWPKDFFGRAMEETRLQMKNAMEKRKKTRE